MFAMFLIPTSSQYIDRVFFVPYAEKPPRRIWTVTSGNISWFLNPGLYGIETQGSGKVWGTITITMDGIQ
jgi:hypothetical protein